ncbi:hypothetical protein CC78DRAFT_587153 [Lojkania enalia]|uniref:Uncharacterized protein n=1 Tax=Lojkania enalia TaxID=147567 RepID=A0A9P4MXP1_9PLEO|nr:hypothetical protein CC78DRAFT_587153 [Didymosphaeria enalia]
MHVVKVILAFYIALASSTPTAPTTGLVKVLEDGTRVPVEITWGTTTSDPDDTSNSDDIMNFDDTANSGHISKSENTNLEKRAAKRVRGYLWRTNCSDQYFEWKGDGCFSYWDGGLRDMYSVYVDGDACYVQGYDDGNCGLETLNAFIGRPTCLRRNENKPFKSVYVSCF